jgi:hypothetical protein
MQIGRKSTKAAYGLWYAICAYGSHVYCCPNIDGRRIRVDHRHRAIYLGFGPFSIHLQSSY